MSGLLLLMRVFQVCIFVIPKINLVLKGLKISHHTANRQQNGWGCRAAALPDFKGAS